MSSIIRIKDDLEIFRRSNNITTIVEGLAPKEQIYLHYCSLDAFYSIIDSGRLRFTSAMSTNDPSEFLFGQGIVDQIIADPPAGLRAHEKSWIKQIRSQQSRRDFRAFVFCMSEALDDEADVGELSQWRLYGADGRGVALVIDASNERGRTLLSELGSVPRKIVYGEDAGRKLVSNVLEGFFDSLRQLPEIERKKLESDPQKICDHIINSIYWLPSVIKHKAYRHEREIRLVRGDVGEAEGNPLVFFEKGSIRRPSIELSIAKILNESPERFESPIRAVIIGPSGNQAAIADSMRYFIEARGWDLEVRKSDIPYRTI